MITTLDTKKSLFFSHNDPEIVKWLGNVKYDVKCFYTSKQTKEEVTRLLSCTVRTNDRSKGGWSKNSGIRTAMRMK